MTAVQRSVTMLAVAVALMAPSLALPAGAHHGYEGPVWLYLDTLRLEPQAEGWLIRAALNDAGSGKRMPGFAVEASGSGPEGADFGPVALADRDGDGWYETGLGPLPAGDWSLSLEVGDLPGGEERAVPLTRTWNVALQPGQGLEILGRPPAPDPGGGSGSGTVAAPLMLGAGAVALFGTATWLSRRRRRTVVPAR